MNSKRRERACLLVDRSPFLTSLGNGQGKLCKLIVSAFLGWAGGVWSYMEPSHTVYFCSCPCQLTELVLSLFTRGRKGSAFHSSPCFHAQSFHGIMLGVDTLQTQCHAVSAVEQLCEICSAISEDRNFLCLFLGHKMSVFLTA